jgi:hypothetical protein
VHFQVQRQTFETGRFFGDNTSTSIHLDPGKALVNAQVNAQKRRKALNVVKVRMLGCSRKQPTIRRLDAKYERQSPMALVVFKVRESAMKENVRMTVARKINRTAEDLLVNDKSVPKE